MDKTPPIVAILGGYGRLGQAVADRLLQMPGVHVVLCGRNPQAAKAATDTLNAKYPGRRVAFQSVDAADKFGLAAALRGMDVVLVCTTSAGHTDTIVRAALAAGTDLIDLRFPQDIIATLRSSEDSIRAAGRCVITQAGHYPGLASTLMRYAGSQWAAMEEVLLATGMYTPAVASVDAAREMVEIIRDFRSQIYQDGRWMRVPPWHGRKIHFERFGTRTCLPTGLEEMNGLPEKFGAKQAAVYLAGGNAFVTAVVAPIVMMLKGIRTRQLTNALGTLLSWAIRTFSRPPFGSVFKMEAVGRLKNGILQRMEVSLVHEDSYLFAACAVVAGLLQYFDGTISGPGLHIMGHEVDPLRFLNDMERLGATFSHTTEPQERPTK